MSSTQHADGASASGRGLLLVFGDPASPEVEVEFNRWYDDVHLGDVLGVPGVVAAARYRRLPSDQDGSPIAQRYVTVYEIEADDIAQVSEALSQAAASMHISDALCHEPRSVIMWFEEVTTRREA